MGDLTISVDTAIIVKLGELAERTQGASDAGLLRVAQHVQQIAVRQAQRIYQRPIPTRGQANAFRRGEGRPRRAGGKGVKAWERTGALMAAIKADPTIAPNKITLEVKLPYAGWRHYLGVSWQPKNPALGIVRTNAFFDEALDLTRPQLQPMYAQEVKNHLEI